MVCFILIDLLKCFLLGKTSECIGFLLRSVASHQLAFEARICHPNHVKQGAVCPTCIALVLREWNISWLKTTSQIYVCDVFGMSSYVMWLEVNIINRLSSAFQCIFIFGLEFSNVFHPVIYVVLVILLAPANDSWTSICLLLHFYSLFFTLVYALHGVFASFLRLGWCFFFLITWRPKKA